MINGVTMKINVDDYIINTLKEDITSEDVSTNAVMPESRQGKAELICKSSGIICGLGVFERTFTLLDENAKFETSVKDGDLLKKECCLALFTATSEHCFPENAQRLTICKE